MLEQIHKHMKWIMWTIVILVTVTFLFFGIYPSSMSGNTIAKVDGYNISADEFNQVYRTMYENYRQILKDQFTDSFAQTLRKQALQELIQNRLLVQESERLGFKVSDEELQGHIVRMAAFNNQGRFDQRIYERTLQNVNITPAVFEANQREYLLRQKLERLVEDSVAVTDAELASAYRIRNPKAKPGEYEKNKATFEQTYLGERKQEALDAYVRGLMSKATIKINDRAIAS
jgi:peptidyl-prolyl cis-trans isomerase D